MGFYFVVHRCSMCPVLARKYAVITLVACLLKWNYSDEVGRILKFSQMIVDLRVISENGYMFC